MSSVSELILSSYQLAAQQQASITQAWIQGSHRLGGALSNSGLHIAIQRVGRLDAVLRCMEEELVGEGLSDAIRPWIAEPLGALSEIWVGQVYEIIRLSKERKLVPDSSFLTTLAHDFRLLRITIEKHEIAQDRSLSEPIGMFRVPAKEDDVDYMYDKKDPQRSHIMPTEISARGSLQWLALDVSNFPSQRWIERRELSDRVLQLLLAV